VYISILKIDLLVFWVTVSHSVRRYGVSVKLTVRVRVRVRAKMWVGG